MKRTSKVIVNALVMSISMTALSSTLSATEQSASLPPFYRSLQEIKAGAMLGKVIKQEKIATTIPNGIAWRIAYNSSDLFDRPTISTAVVVAPVRRYARETKIDLFMNEAGQIFVLGHSSFP